MAYLTSANYLIKIINKSGTLKDIAWTGFDGFKFNFGSITAHNGKRPIVAVTPPEPSVITLTKQANPTEDKLILKWLGNFCTEDSLDGSGEVSSGDTLVVIPKRTCTDKLITTDRLELYSIVPAGDMTLWNADVTNKNQMSTNSMQFRYTSSNLLDFN